ncbi:hypothetical protein LTR10_021416 [Elasticomyces elasticus]|nr:hypothetical protein LTR10_021416 [Elasticomyces elasticus]KAK4971805.1 hypothetical protein LTR42_007533 [Elasticomyces elasticus]
MPMVIFTDNIRAKFEDHPYTDLTHYDSPLGIGYTTQGMFEVTMQLLSYKCPDECCDKICAGWPDLHRHIESDHFDKTICGLCAIHKNLFTQEHQLYSIDRIHQHMEGHPECAYCNKRFFGCAELSAHMTIEHERCFVCDEWDDEAWPQYYVDCEALRKHHECDHYPCLNWACQKLKNVTFVSKGDLDQHSAEEHGAEPARLIRHKTLEAARAVRFGELINYPGETILRGGPSTRVYNRGFLLEFQKVCKMEPLADWVAKIGEIVRNKAATRGGRGGRCVWLHGLTPEATGKRQGEDGIETEGGGQDRATGFVARS